MDQSQNVSETQPVIWVMLVFGGVVEMLNIQWCTVLISDLLSAKRALIPHPGLALCLLAPCLWCVYHICTIPLWMAYTQKPGCCALNNSMLKEMLRDISHDNNEIANSCITATIRPYQCLRNLDPCTCALNSIPVQSGCKLQYCTHFKVGSLNALCVKKNEHLRKRPMAQS